MYIGEYELESPLMNGGGLVRSVEDVRIMARTAVSAVMAGSYTIQPRAGNSPNGEVVYHHETSTGITYNALGMPNRGMEYVAKNINEMIDIAHDHGKPLILNFAPVTHDPRGEVEEMAEMLARANVQDLDALELNASCPNVVTAMGGRRGILSHHPRLLADVLGDLSDMSWSEIPVARLFVRIAPFRSEFDAIDLARVVHATDIDAVAAFNTFPGGKPLDAQGHPILQVPGGEGGRSGPGMTEVTEKQTEWLITARMAIGGHFDVIGSNGIASGEDIKRRLDLGASAVSATTAFYEARSWVNTADKLLREYSRAAS